MYDIDRVRSAKERLKAVVRTRPWYRGVGIAPHPEGPLIRLTVAPNAPDDELPTSFEGISIEIVRMDAYEPRG